MTSNSATYTGPWKNERVPYLVDIMDVPTSRSFSACFFATRAQSAKTEAMINWILADAKPCRHCHTPQ
jgi:phage terminase large subunit GpA-like protein